MSDRARDEAVGVLGPGKYRQLVDAGLDAVYADPVAWRIDYTCGHHDFTADFKRVGSYRAGACPWEDGGELESVSALFTNSRDPEGLR